MHQLYDIRGNGPAEYFRVKGSKGAIGFISNYSKDFCGDCSRVRVDCAGRIAPCLFSGPVFDAKPMLQAQQDEKLLEEIECLISHKSQFTKLKNQEEHIHMSRVGG